MGPAPRLLGGFELVKPGEGEVAAGIRLIEQLYTPFKHFAGVVVVDAAYAAAPFLRLIEEIGLHFVVRLKDVRMEIYKDAHGLFSKREPDAQWGEEGLESWGSLGRPLRLMFVEETFYDKRTPGRRVRGITVATSLSRNQAPASTRSTGSFVRGGS